MIVLHPETGTPLWLQLKDHLRDAIGAGRFSPGEPAPAARDLAADAGVNYHTAARALRGLEEDGLLVRQRGDVWKVAADATSRARGVWLDEELAALVARAEGLGWGPEEVLDRLDRLVTRGRRAIS